MQHARRRMTEGIEGTQTTTTTTTPGLGISLTHVQLLEWVPHGFAVATETETRKIAMQLNECNVIV